MAHSSDKPTLAPQQRPRRRWLSFSLRTLLIALMLGPVAIWGLVSWLRQPEAETQTLPGGMVWRVPTKAGKAAMGGMGGESRVDDGPFTLRDRQKRVLATGRFADGVAVGRWVHYHPSGRQALSGEQVEGLPTGEWTAWDERGYRRLAVTYEPVQKSPNMPAGDTAPLGWASWKLAPRNSRSGPARQWWPTGKLKAEGKMQDDLREGRWTFWDERGQKTAQGDYRGGLRQGEWTLYDTPGGPPRTALYRDGREIANHQELLARLGEQLRSGSRDARFQAVEGLGKLGPAAAPLLAEALASDDGPLLLWTLRALVEIGPESREAIPAIEKLRTSADRELKGEALVALFLLDEPRRAVLFRELVQLTDPSDPAACLTWHSRLAELGQPALPAIEQLLDDPQANVRLWTLSVLARMIPISSGVIWVEPHLAQAIKLLEKARQDKDPRISLPAREVLERLPNIPWRQNQPLFVNGVDPVVG